MIIIRTITCFNNDFINNNSNFHFNLIHSRQDLHSGNGWRSKQFDQIASSYEPMAGTATLNRPRGLVKPRPVAKVTGTSTTSLRDALNDEDDTTDQLTKEVNNLKDAAQGQQTATTPGSVTKRILGPLPPTKPPLTAVTVGSAGGNDAFAETAFATCVQSLTSRFTLATLGGDREDKDDALPAVPPPMNATLRSISKISQITAQNQQAGGQQTRGTVEEMNKVGELHIRMGGDRWQGVTVNYMGCSEAMYTCQIVH